MREQQFHDKQIQIRMFQLEVESMSDVASTEAEERFNLTEVSLFNLTEVYFFCLTHLVIV